MKRSKRQAPNTRETPTEKHQTPGSRGVGWAAGPIQGTDMVYAAMMEGDRSFPGRMMAERLDAAFRRAKLSKEAPTP